MPDDLSGLRDEFRHNLNHVADVDGCRYCDRRREYREGVVRLPAEVVSLERRLRRARARQRLARAWVWLGAISGGAMLYASFTTPIYLLVCVLYAVQICTALHARNFATENVAELEARLPPSARALPP